MLDKITGKTPVAAYVSPIVEGKVLRHRGGGKPACYVRATSKPKHEFNYQQAVERLLVKRSAQLNDPAYRRLRIVPITSNRKSTPLSVEEMQAVNAVLYGKYTMEGTSLILSRWISGALTKEITLSRLTVKMV